MLVFFFLLSEVVGIAFNLPSLDVGVPPAVELTALDVDAERHVVAEVEGCRLVCHVVEEKAGYLLRVLFLRFNYDCLFLPRAACSVALDDVAYCDDFSCDFHCCSIFLDFFV